MRVATITFHSAYNFGSALQALALQQALTEMGHHAEIIDYRGRDSRQYRLFRLSRPTTMIRQITQFRARLRRRNAFHKFWRDHLRMTEKTYTTRSEKDLSLLTESFDAFIAGSDQIWNLDCTQGVVGPYFLDFAGQRRRISYGPSLSHKEFKEENFDRERIRALLADFSAISVREGATQSTFQDLSPSTIEVVADPVVLTPVSEWLNLVDPATGPSGDYIFVYMLEPSPDLIRSARQTGASSGLPICYISEKRIDLGPRARNYFGVGPIEFLSLLAGARAVITNSFHASLFTMLFHVPLRVFETSRSFSRIEELLAAVGVDLAGDSGSGLPDAFDWARVDQAIEAIRASSLEYLSHSLEE